MSCGKELNLNSKGRLSSGAEAVKNEGKMNMTKQNGEEMIYQRSCIRLCISLSSLIIPQKNEFYSKKNMSLARNIVVILKDMWKHFIS